MNSSCDVPDFYRRTRPPISRNVYSANFLTVLVSGIGLLGDEGMKDTSQSIRCVRPVSDVRPCAWGQTSPEGRLIRCEWGGKQRLVLEAGTGYLQQSAEEIL